MDSSFDKLNGLSLPEPLPPASAGGEIAPAENGQKAEQASAAPERTPQPSNAPSFSAPPVSPLPITPPPAVSTTPPSTSQPVAGSPAVADDRDLIEKEWVVKAKQIVANTRNDPYQQNKQLTAFKADYLQKRYQKTLKLSE